MARKVTPQWQADMQSGLKAANSSMRAINLANKKSKPLSNDQALELVRPIVSLAISMVEVIPGAENETKNLIIAHREILRTLIGGNKEPWY